MKRLMGVFIFIFAVMAGGAQQGWADHHEMAAQEVAKAQSYTCPMHPEVKKDAPGKCDECGMDLIEAVEGEVVTMAGEESDQAVS